MSRDGRHRGPPAHRWITRPCAFAFAAKVIAMSPLSSAIGALRRLRGWSQQDLASRASIPLASLVEAEISSPTDDVSRSVARLFGVDAYALAQGKVRTANEPRAQSPHAVFLFHDERSAFDSGDLEVFAKALNIGRAWLSNEIGERGRQRRHALTPIPAVGPAPRDAAQQGYGLARMVRAQLGNPTDPLPDLVELAEQTFGVPVVSQRLRSSGGGSGEIVGPFWYSRAGAVSTAGVVGAGGAALDTSSATAGNDGVESSFGAVSAAPGAGGTSGGNGGVGGAPSSASAPAGGTAGAPPTSGTRANVLGHHASTGAGGGGGCTTIISSGGAGGSSGTGQSGGAGGASNPTKRGGGGGGGGGYDGPGGVGGDGSDTTVVAPATPVAAGAGGGGSGEYGSGNGKSGAGANGVVIVQEVLE